MPETVEEFFKGYEGSRELFTAIRGAIDAIGTPEMRVTKSQIAFRRKKPFAWVWIPGRYLRGRTAPLVLTLSLPERDPSPRWKEIVQPATDRFIHHLELFSGGDIDEEVRRWLRAAWLAAA